MNDLISRRAAIEAMRKAKDKSELHRMLVQLPSAQPTGTNTVQVEDCISRAAVVDAIEGVDWYHQNENGEMVHGANSAEHQAWYKAEDIYKAIEGVPSAQPGWTYIEEALPKTIINKHTHDFQEYNCLCDFGEYGFDVRTYKFGNGHFWNGGGIADKYVTAWQPLPEIPNALKQKPWEGDANG